MTTPESIHHSSGSKDPAITGTSQKIWGFFASTFTLIAVIFLVSGIRGCATDRRKKIEAEGRVRAVELEASRKFAATNTTVTAGAPVVISPNVVYAMTPIAIVADYEFNIEADGPLMVQYPGEKPVLFTPGKGFQQLPQPRQSGAKVFKDAKDPGGNVKFRIYRIRQ